MLVHKIQLKAHIFTDRDKKIEVTKPEKLKTYKWLKLIIYSEILGTIEAVLVIGATLYVCKATGLYAFWMQLIGKFV